MRKKSIVIIDSGLGGLHILKECAYALPSYEFLFIADTFNAPYGNKSRKQLIQIAYDLVEKIIKKYNPEIVVFACNTLTVSTIKKVREKFFKTKFVGVEPAIKKAKIFGGDTIIFATKSTLKFYKRLNKKVDNELRNEYKKQNLKYFSPGKIYRVYVPTLPSLIEENAENLDNLLPILSKTFKDKKYLKCLNMVLGCTHYIAIKEQLNEVFPSIKFFDGAKAVASRVKAIASHPDCTVETPPKIKIVTTSGDISKQKSFENYFNKIYLE